MDLCRLGADGLALLASGIGARALLDKIVPNWLIGTTGSVLIMFSAFCFVAAVWRQMSKSARPVRTLGARLPLI